VNAEDLEGVHRRFCKSIPGVPSTATNLAVYGELGRVPLEIKRKCTPHLTQRSLWHAHAKRSFIKQTLSNLGFSNVWINPASMSQVLFLDELE